MPLPGATAIVIRGGLGRDPQALFGAMQERRDAGLPMCVSVFATVQSLDQTAEEHLRDLCRAATARWGALQVTTVERLTDQGFDLVDERTSREADCHYHVYFSENMSVLDAQRFLECFDEPRPSPLTRAERNLL